MRRSATLIARTLVLAIVALAAVFLWQRHATAWNPGFRTPLLSYDAAQYAVAARELAEHGRLATPFALPIELSKHASPPWPLAVVQPGLVLSEAAAFKTASLVAPLFGRSDQTAPARGEWIALLLPFICYLAIAMALALGAMRLLGFLAPGLPAFIAAGAGLTLAAGFLLDPEAQHFAGGGFTELPFTLGWLMALGGLVMRGAAPAKGHTAVDWPRGAAFGLGVLLGLTGLFRGTMLWIAPIVALAAAFANPRGHRLSVCAFVVLGFTLPLAPWWIYKWASFGSPAWDLSAFSVWDGVQGHTWFSLFHDTAFPDLPRGSEAAGILAGKIARNLPTLALALFTGPRALWIGALVLWLLVTRRPSGLRAAAITVLLATVATSIAAAASVPWLRYIFPVRIALEAAGVLALWDLAGHLPRASAGPAVVGFIRGVAAALVIAWGLFQTSAGLAEARASLPNRGLPDNQTIRELVTMMDAEIPPGAPVMSNLGPTLAWFGRRPVVHLAADPAGIDACRAHVDTRHVLLVFRDASRAWPGWTELMQQPAAAPNRPEWNISRVRVLESEDGFVIVWLEMGPRAPSLAMVRLHPSR